jgi:hypothetical protein
VYRVSRVHSAWFDTGSSGTDYVLAIPRVVANEDTGHNAVSSTCAAPRLRRHGRAESDAGQLDAYGELRTGAASFLNGDNTWKGNPSGIDGARYVQLRITLVNDLEPRLFQPSLDSLALAYRR